jgi:hypothetical protein
MLLEKVPNKEILERTILKRKKWVKCYFQNRITCLTEEIMLRKIVSSIIQKEKSTKISRKCCNGI